MSVVWLIDNSKQNSIELDRIAKHFAVRIIDIKSFQSALRTASLPHVVVMKTGGSTSQEVETTIAQALEQLPQTYFVFTDGRERSPYSEKDISAQKKIYFYQDLDAVDLIDLLHRLFLFNHEDGRSVHYHGLQLNMERLECWLAHEQRAISLSFKEAKLLRFFIQSAGVSLSRSDILSKVWENVRVSPRTIDCHISRLRRKLANAPVNIESIYGGGYVFS